MRAPRFRHPPATRCLLALVVPWSLAVGGCGRGDAITVGSKNFTESVLLGEIAAQALEQAGYAVVRKLDLGGTFVCHEALVAGQIDVYVEYTGTAYGAILERPTTRDRRQVRRIVDSVYGARWDLEWTEPLGFDNTFAMLIRRADAEQLGVSTLSQAAPFAPQWRAGFGYEFMEREDGYAGLTRTYDLTFKGQPSVMDLGLTYRALADGKVDIIAGNSTDGQIAALDLVPLVDDRRYFPPYEAAPVARRATLRSHPGVRDVLRRLGGTIDAAAMRAMNYEVDVKKRDVSVVAREFLAALRAQRPPASPGTRPAQGSDSAS